MCDYRAQQKGKLKFHKNTVHGSGHRVQCVYCPKTFSADQSLKRHLIEVHAKKQLQCSFCDFVCQRLHNLNLHVKENHLQEKSPKRKAQKTQIDITEYAEAMTNIYKEAQTLKEKNGEKKIGRPRGAFGKRKIQMFDTLNYLSYYKDKFDANMLFNGQVPEKFNDVPIQLKEVSDPSHTNK